jgi:hypothetical protein
MMGDVPRGYREEALRQLLATDPRVLEPELEVEIVGDLAIIRGVVPTETRRAAIDVVVAEQGEFRVENRTEVASFPAPTTEERVR